MDGRPLVSALKSLLESPVESRLEEALAEAHPADIAHLLPELARAQQVAIFRLLPPDRAGDVLSEVDNQTLIDLVTALDEVEVSRIFDRMPPDHVAEVVEELPAAQAEKVLDLMADARSEEVQELLEYGEDTAGRLMSPNAVAVGEDATVTEAIDRVRKSATEGRGFEVYVVDAHRHLLGTVPLRRLLTAAPLTLVSAIRDPEAVSVSPETDQEEVARLVAKYDLVAIPVVDQSHRLLGTIAVEDIIDVLGEEASEDIFRLAGSDASELEKRSPRQIALMRLPWIFTTLLIELGAGAIIHFYDATLSRVILLASFMPVIQAISGNTGLQSVTMVVRGLATGHVRLARWWEPLVRQVQTTSIIGAVCGLTVGVVGYIWQGSFTFAAVVAASMFISVNLSGLAGTGFPMVSKRLGFDPALTAGPFETAFQDLVGVTIFLSLATAALRWML
jgi:magnesium transporter